MGFFNKLFKSSKKDDKFTSWNNHVNDESKESNNFKYLDNLIHGNGSSLDSINQVFQNINEIEDRELQDLVGQFVSEEVLVQNEVKIILNSDIVLSGDEESQYLEGIRLDVDNLIIDGNGYTIDAKGKTRIFLCTGKNITIKNIILKNGYAAQYGGAIRNGGDLSIIESTLQNNKAEYGGAIRNEGKLTITKSTLTDGGTIHNYNGELNILKSELMNSTAKYGGAIHNEGGEVIFTDSAIMRSTAKYGGAILNEDGEIIITESTLRDNTAEYGGAIRSSGVLSISQSRLQNNTSQKDGGAIRSSGVLSISQSRLQSNTSQKDGGAISNDGSLTITESVLSDNTSNNGGAIINNGGELTITESTLQNNISNEDGGALCHKEGNFKIYDCKILNNKSLKNVILNNDSLQIYNTDIRGNKSKDIIFNDGYESNLSIFGNKIIENNVEESVLYNDGKFCSIEKTIFENNISDNSMNIINKSELTLISPKINDKGKTILNQRYMLLRKSSPEFKNIISGEGKVETDGITIPKQENFDFGYLDKKIHECKTKKIILDQNIILGNYESDYYEGGIELDIDNLVIDGNGKTINGADKTRIFIITAKNIILKNIIFKNGHSHKNYDNPLNNDGGAIKINHNSSITIENCEFKNNISEGRAGAIHSNGELSIAGSSLQNNASQEDGGAIYTSGKLSIAGSSLQNNASQEDGGAIRTSGKLSIVKSTLSDNTARHGGAIRSDEELSIVESSLQNNASQEDGGAIRSDGELSIAKSTLSNNKANWYGGAIRTYWKLTIIESTLSDNSANWGGAISNYEGELNIIESTLTDNIAKYSKEQINNINEKSFNIKNCNL